MEITQKEINEIHPVATEMLKVFIEICEKLNLHYYIFYGSLIGAVRHNGFIPWDDDIDIVMPRKDYNILVRKANDMLPNNYFLQTPYNEPNYIFTFSKLRKSDTTYVEDRCKYIKMNHGLWIDVFCLDYVATSWWDRFKINYVKKYVAYATADSQSSPEERLKYTLIKRIAVFLYKIIFPNVSKSTQLIDKIHESVRCSLKYTINNSIYNEEIPIEWFGEGTNLIFEGISVKAPLAFDKCLRLMYNNYMQLPPEDKRIPRHEVAYFDLGKSYLEYMEK